MTMNMHSVAAGGEAAIHSAGLAVNKADPAGETEIRAAVKVARSAAIAKKSRSESTGWQVGEFTGLPIALFQNWLYERNREWRFTDGTLCVLWCVEFPHARSDYAKNHRYIASTRRDYNNGKHQAPAPAVPCVAYDRRGEPTEFVPAVGRVAQGAPPIVKPQPMTASAPSVPRSGAGPGGAVAGMTILTDPKASAARLAKLEAYMKDHVLGAGGMVCASYGKCLASHSGQFFEGQLHHVGRHFDVCANGTQLRVVVVGQEYGNGPARVTLAERYQDVAVRTGLMKRFRGESGRDARNPHMRGTTSLLRLAFGREPGERHDDEFFETPGGRVHVYEMFALVNFLLCSAIATGESAIGSKQGRSTPAMQANCAPHFVRAIEILQPTLVVAEGKGTFRWMERILRDERPVAETLRWVRIGQHETLLATFTHPSAHGLDNWADLSRSYLHDVVTPTIREARRLLIG